MNKTKRCLHGLAFIAVLAASAAIVMLLWNALLPAILGAAAINYWQAAGLMILARLLLGTIGRPGRFGHRHGGRCHPGHFHDQMHGMSRDERREFIRKRMGGMFCDERKPGQDGGQQ